MLVELVPGQRSKCIVQSVSQAEVAAGECLSTKMRVICEPAATEEQLVGGRV